MTTPTETRALTLRIPTELHSAITELAHSRSVSVNAYIQQQLEGAVRLAVEQARYDAYTLLGQDAEACDVEYAAAAQAEVMLSDDE
jgi:hypothetical protein